MKQEEQLPKGFITLKEASQMTGYSPDYIGQLIRRGKLYGKQISYNVAWVTTKAAILDYADKGREEKSSSGYGWRRGLADATIIEDIGARLERRIATGAIVILGIFAVFLVYIFFVQIDRAIAERAARGQEGETVEQPPGAFYTSHSP